MGFFLILPTHLLNLQICVHATHRQPRRKDLKVARAASCQVKASRTNREAARQFHNGTRCGVSHPGGRPAAIGACSGAREKPTGKQKSNFTRGKKRAPGQHVAGIRVQSDPVTHRRLKVNPLHFAATPKQK